MLSCCYCSKECKNANSHQNHERLCPNNPNRNYKNGMKDKIPWNKGLTKNDPRVLKNAQATSSSLKGKPGGFAAQRKPKLFNTLFPSRSREGILLSLASFGFLGLHL